jgi:hypothetical protein
MGLALSLAPACASYGGVIAQQPSFRHKTHQREADRLPAIRVHPYHPFPSVVYSSGHPSGTLTLPGSGRAAGRPRSQVPGMRVGRPRSQEARGALMLPGVMLPGARCPSPVGASRRSARASARRLRMRARRPRPIQVHRCARLRRACGRGRPRTQDSTPWPRRGFQALSEGFRSPSPHAGETPAPHSSS